MVNIYWARLKLWQWGRAVRDSGIGYPSMSSHEQIRSGAGVMVVAVSLPEDLEAVNSVVHEAPPQHKLILVEHYTKDGRANEHAARLNLKRAHYFERKKTAEEYVSKRL
jgi:hypothetical protein